MIVADFMIYRPLTLSSDDTLQVARETMDASGLPLVPVTADGKLLGMVTDRDVRQQVGQLNKIRVGAVMSQPPFSAHPSTPIAIAARMLARSKIGSLPLVDNGNLLGMITTRSLLQALEAVLAGGDNGSVGVELDVAGSGETTAVISLMRSIGPLIATGNTNSGVFGKQTLYLVLPADDAERRIDMLRRYGFKVLAIDQESAV